MYVCEACRQEGEDFRVPADWIGVALMKEHLHERHDVPRIAPRRPDR